MTRERSKLTPKQERFVQEYLMDVNTTQAAIRAGYSKKTAQKQSSRLLSNVMVSKAIAKGIQALAEKAGVMAKKVVAEMARIGFANMQDYLDLSDPENPTIDLSKITSEQASVIAEQGREEGASAAGDDQVTRQAQCLGEPREASRIVQRPSVTWGLDGSPIQHRTELVFVEPTKRMNSN